MTQLGTPNVNEGFPVKNHEGRPAICTPGIEPRRCECCPGAGENASGKFTVTIAGTALGIYGTKAGCTCDCACDEDVDGTYEFDIPEPRCGGEVLIELNELPGECEFYQLSVLVRPDCWYDEEFNRTYYYVNVSAALIPPGLITCKQLEFWEVDDLITNVPPISSYLEGDCFTGFFAHDVNRASGHGFPPNTDESTICPRCYAKQQGTITVQFHNT